MRMGLLASGAAHELGTPLATIKLVAAELIDELAGLAAGAVNLGLALAGGAAWPPAGAVAAALVLGSIGFLPAEIESAVASMPI